MPFTAFPACRPVNAFCSGMTRGSPVHAAAFFGASAWMPGWFFIVFAAAARMVSRPVLRRIPPAACAVPSVYFFPRACFMFHAACNFVQWLSAAHGRAGLLFMLKLRHGFFLFLWRVCILTGYGAGRAEAMSYA